MPRVDRVLWLGLLTVVALRPWVLDLVVPERILTVQWAGLCIGLAWWLSQRGWRKPLHPHLLWPCLLLWFGCLTSATLSEDRLEALLQAQALTFGIVLCAAAALAPWPRRQQLLIVLIAASTALALHGLWQAAVLFPAFERFDWSRLTPEAYVADFATEVIARRRVFGPFPLPGLLAAALILLLPVSVSVLRPWATTPPRRLIARLVFGVQGAALLLTQSLGGFCALGAATVVVLLIRRRPWWQPASVLCLALVCIGTLLLIRPELSNPDHPRNPIVQRFRYWQSTAGMIRDHPLRGIGAGNYALVYPRYQRPQATQARFAHNAWLQTWAEWGIVGLVGLAALSVGSIRLASGHPIGFQIALWAFWMLASIDITWSILQVACLFWPLLGILSHTDHAERREAVRRGGGPDRTPA